jgi:copine 5/8/9
VINAYHHCIRSVQLFGPTNFSPVINHVAKFAQAYQDGSQYFILLIITDGVITDMFHTKQVLITNVMICLKLWKRLIYALIHVD